jgi:signal transduction histidine kinase
MRWYRSLYWRIALGFVLCLATMLVVQAVLFVWVASRSGPTVPGQPLDRFAETVALDLAAGIEGQPGLDVAQYITDQYGRAAHPFFVMMADGRLLSNGGGRIPPTLLAEARARLRARVPTMRRPDRPARVLRPGLAFRPTRTAPIVVAGHVAGVVVVPPQAGFGFLFRRYAPTMTVVALSALVVGALLTAVVIFGPTRRRLRGVEDAARRLGGGDLAARAPDQGGDEVTAVATAFNQMADRLASADRARRQLLADVSHELTTPVTAMRGYLETLAMPELGIDDRTRARYLGIIGDETERLERIIGDLLDLARLEGGGGTLAIADVPTADLFARVAERHERTSGQAGITVRTVVEPGAERLRADGDRLEQALQNLTANAMRYAPNGTAVELRARVVDAGIAITVADEGPGIAPDHLPHVFDRFYKADASRTPHGESVGGGSGLGLSIVKAIVERHGGRVSVASRPGRTVFEFTIYSGPHSAAIAAAPAGGAP